MRTDIVLLFVPQWSPFQPPLSLPSLAAWLRRAGYEVGCLDANIRLYRWLLSEDCALHLIGALEQSDLSPSDRSGYRAVFRCHADFKAQLDALRWSGSAPTTPDEKQQYVQNHYLGIKALSSYLEAISAVCPDFRISPYEFRLKATSQTSSTALERFAERPPPILREFLTSLIDSEIAPRSPRVVGLSCIGEDQLAFTLLFGKTLRERLGVPVLVGGTILPRIFERGALEPRWLGRYFDMIVRNEGERPCETILSNSRRGLEATAAVPGIIYAAEGQVRSTEPATPLRVEEVPIPDFDDLALEDYVCSEITLPILSSRGCYWGKCEFCHHYMVYGDRYVPYKAPDVVDVIQQLALKYGVRHFAFNDEAIPPKIIQAMGQQLPDHETSRFTFTGLIKFEKFYTPEHFAQLSRVGFRSLYVGLESASERVLELMKKPNTPATILANLGDASRSGIWMHCFLFFGFPGETEDDARQTFDFVCQNPDVIGSFGGGVFSLEHNAPIQKHPGKFGLKLMAGEGSSDVSVYYDYSTSTGISKERAGEWCDRLMREALGTNDKYRATNWIPREFLLCLLSYLNPEELVGECVEIDRNHGLPPGATVANLVSVLPLEDSSDDSLVVNRVVARVMRARNAARTLFELCVRTSMNAKEVSRMNPSVERFLSPGVLFDEDSPPA